MKPDYIRILMKIGIITGDLQTNRTGIGTYIYHLVTRLSARYKITVIRHESGMDIPSCDSLIIKTPFFERYNSLLWNQWLRWHKKELELFDIIHNPGQFLTCSNLGRHQIVTIHDITPIVTPFYHFPFRTWTNRIFLPSVLHSSERIIADSNHTKQDICKVYGIAPEKIDVIHLAADPLYQPMDKEKILAWRAEKNLDYPYLLFVGTIEPRKNIETLIKAFEMIADSFRDLHIVLSGNRGWNSEPIFEMIGASRYSERIHWLDYVPLEELPLLYSGARAFIYPSWYEGFGFPPLEAMQCGTPVICSSSSSLPEVVGKDGIMVAPDDLPGFAREITRVLTDESFREKMVLDGFQQANLFSWEKTVEKTAEVYESILRKDTP